MVNLLMYWDGCPNSIYCKATNFQRKAGRKKLLFSFIRLTNLDVLVLSFFSPSFDKDSSSWGLRLLLLMITDLLTTVADYHGPKIVLEP